MHFDRHMREVVETANERLVVVGIPTLVRHDRNDDRQVPSPHSPEVQVRDAVVPIRLDHGLDLAAPRREVVINGR
jgi:hypothetical protein